MRQISSLAAAACIAVLVASGCRTDVAPAERVGAAAEELQQSNLVGTSLPAKTLALTFDDGPGDRTTELSSYLAAQGIHATFFMCGGHLAATALPNPNGLTPVANAAAVVAQLEADGHLVANHTTTHRDLVTQVLPTGAANVVSELTETDADIAGHVASNHFLFRAPYGSYSADVFNALSGTPMNKYVGPVYWEMGGSSTDYPNKAADWACWQGSLYAGAQLANGTGYATTTQCGDAYLNEIHAVGRGIVLMHDPYSWAQGSTVDMVKYLVPILKNEGYSFVRADDIPTIAALLPPKCDASCATCNGPAANQCTSCAAGAYLQNGSCHACSHCAAGQHLVAACSSAADTQCAACAAGTFSSALDAASCSSCAAGTYSGAGASSCATCAAGTYSAAGAGSCTSCAAGTYAAAGASSCTTCPPGTFSQAGAASCDACGGCDDHDACTKDACDGVAGCTHVHIDGCVPDAGAGAHDAGLADAAADASGGPDPRADASADPTTAAPADPFDAGDVAPSSSDASGCSVGAAPHTSPGGGFVFAVALAIAAALRSRRDGAA